MKARQTPPRTRRTRAGKLYGVEVTPVRKLKRPVRLSEIKADTWFAHFALGACRGLSVMLVTDEQWEWIEAIARGSGAD